jgi:hypothetical protein
MPWESLRVGTLKSYGSFVWKSTSGVLKAPLWGITKTSYDTVCPAFKWVAGSLTYAYSPLASVLPPSLLITAKP